VTLYNYLNYFSGCTDSTSVLNILPDSSKGVFFTNWNNFYLAK
jgi:hypothetical protein